MVYGELLYKIKWPLRWKMTGFSVQDCPLWPCSIGPSCHDFAKPKHKASQCNMLKRDRHAVLSVFSEGNEGNESEAKQLHFLSVQL